MGVLETVVSLSFSTDVEQTQNMASFSACIYCYSNLSSPTSIYYDNDVDD